ncbi:preprotein translocase subunit TatC [Paenibacillus sp. 7124]|uniref:Sec-independent protein translocase protein TatC n=1 Tax=Paenibacillus apii TaxID=1850370 RepID=A0A6M1PNM6_9BACL|nr:twin-arginine translocase subunit TatC [Paenibacillus apii]NGM84114.1 preprotein translocase subunit TatC [Paenibacillus apii]NJJ38705.1 preprotein translocase subunit TatC [Paenibacillus apii]
MWESENIVKAVRWLGKFRARILAGVLFVIVAATAVYAVSDPLLKLLCRPLQDQPLFYMTPVDGVMTKLKVAMFGGIVASFPVLAGLIVSMFAPLLGRGIRLKIYFLAIPLAVVLFAGGIAFAYEFILPNTVDFLIKSGQGVLSPMIAGSAYVSFMAFFLISVALVFELPIVMVTLSRIGLIHSKMLMRKRKFAILGIAIILAILSPTPDAFSLLAESIPVAALYEISIWTIYLLERKGMQGMKRVTTHD